jgi:uncharacterized UPF0160 family protein
MLVLILIINNYTIELTKKCGIFIYMYTVVTHSGKFHCDDIFGVATLRLCFGAENLTIIRSREEEVIAQADIVLDVGGVYDVEAKRFDHHQPGAPVRDDGLPYAAFGLVWKEYGEHITGSKRVTEAIEKKLVVPVDASDNGVMLYEVNHYGVAPAEIYDVFESLMPPLGSDGDPDEAFMEAVKLAEAYLLRLIEREKINEVLLERVHEVYISSPEHDVLVFDEPMKRSVLVPYSDVKVIVVPGDGDDRWIVSAIPVSEDSFESRVYFPESWAGLRDEELESVSGIKGAIFCHKNRFMFVATTKETAIKAATLAK